MNRILNLSLILSATCVALTGCGNRLTEMARLPTLSVYKVEVAQGNIVTPEMLAGVRRGMEKRQVRVLVGTPTVADPFHADRWDYPYSIQNDGERRMRLVSLHFIDDRLDRITGDVVGSYTLPEIDEFAAKTTVSVPPRGAPKERSWLSRMLPGGKSDRTPTTVAGFTGEKAGKAADDTAATKKSAPEPATGEQPVADDPDAGLFDGLLDRVGG